jgi:hypothetical protein
MAHAYDPDALDPDLQLLKNFDEAWLTDLPLIRELTRQEQQAEKDRAFAAEVAGETVDEVPNELRKMAMLLDDFDDDIDNEDEQTSTSLAATNNTSTIHTTTNNHSQPKP